MRTHQVRKRIYIAVEGEGEQSFIRRLQHFADLHEGLHVHLDCKVLGGGGYEAMLEQAQIYRERDKKRRAKAKLFFLLVDEDRAQRKEDGWTLEHLKQEAKRIDFQVCIQSPNQEGLLLRLFEGNENNKPDASTITNQLQKQWPDYKKPVDFHQLQTRFGLTDLFRAARFDEELRTLLTKIGFNETN